MRADSLKTQKYVYSNRAAWYTSQAKSANIIRRSGVKQDHRSNVKANKQNHAQQEQSIMRRIQFNGKYAFGKWPKDRPFDKPSINV